MDSSIVQKFNFLICKYIKKLIPKYLIFILFNIILFMNIITLICRDGEIKACQEELTSTCDFFKTYFSIDMNDNKKEIFIPFTKDIVVNFLNFINKNKELVDFSKLKDIRKYCGCDYNDNLDEFKLISNNTNYYNISSSISKGILKEIKNLYIKNNINIDNQTETSNFINQYMNTSNDITYYYRWNHENNKHLPKEEKINKLFDSFKIYQIKDKVFELDILECEIIIEQFYRNYHNDNNLLTLIKDIGNKLSNLDEIKEKFDKMNDFFDKFNDRLTEINNTLEKINNEGLNKLTYLENFNKSE